VGRFAGFAYLLHHRLRTAYIRINGGNQEAKRQAQAWLSPFESHLTEAGLGHISEIFEGDAPHRSCGCIAQAWSVAEIFRVYIEEVRGLRPNPRPSGRSVQARTRLIALVLPGLTMSSDIRSLN
jgi:glycogen debranching enzyme